MKIVDAKNIPFNLIRNRLKFVFSIANIVLLNKTKPNQDYVNI